MTDAMTSIPPSQGPNYGSVPVPDPTTLTTAIVTQAKADLRREAESLRELIEARVAALEGVVGALGVAVDKMPNSAAHSAVQDQITIIRTQIDRLFTIRGSALQDATNFTVIAVDHLRGLHEERFDAIQQQFNERDVRGEQEKKASKEALDAALLAQKESVSQQNDANTTAATKSETSFTKQIDQIGTLIATLEKSLTDRITELKERIDRGEGAGSGQLAERQEMRAIQTESHVGTGVIAAIVSAGLVGVGLIVSVLIAVSHIH